VSAVGWERVDKYAQRKGGFTVAAVKLLRAERTNIGTKGKTPNIGGRLEWAFEVWNGKDWLGLFDTADEARAFAEERMT
jgi:hypothetical protein